MNIAIVGLQKKVLEQFIRVHYPTLKVTAKRPEVICCYGGDGTLLYGERLYPGIPKVLIRNSHVCQQCAQTTRDMILQFLVERAFTITSHIKLEGFFQRKKRIGLNDIVIGHPRVNGTVRAKIYINGKQYRREFLGDGVIVATPLGSTGYYQSITSSNFFAGIGIAFNNAVTIVNHLVISDDVIIDVEITRGPAVCVADNDEHSFALSTGDRVRIKKSRLLARVVQFPDEYASLNLITNRMPLAFCQICRSLYE